MKANTMPREKTTKKVAKKNAQLRADNHAVAVTILSRIGKPVKFTYPEPEPSKCGRLKDRAVIHSSESTVPYWDIIDLIEFPDEPEGLRKWIRIGYYRKPKDRLIFAGQTTITEPIKTWRKLLIHAAKEKPWFRKLLEEALAKAKGK